MYEIPLLPDLLLFDSLSYFWAHENATNLRILCYLHVYFIDFLLNILNRSATKKCLETQDARDVVVGATNCCAGENCNSEKNLGLPYIAQLDHEYFQERKETLKQSWLRDESTQTDQ